jgi:PKD repeat protein
MKKRILLLATMLFLILGMATTLNAQEPTFADHVPNQFGLVDPTGGDPAISVSLILVDIDHDDTLEAFVRSFAAFANPLFEPQTLDYYENAGSNEAPAFVFEDSYPFGIPGPSVDWIWQFVDIDGDTLDELFFIGWTSDSPIMMRENTGTLAVPNFDNSFVVNPYGITLPVSPVDGDLLDGLGPTFADIDNDGDFDLFYGGWFNNNAADEAFYFSENEDPSDNGTDPQFAAPVKNPFGLTMPAGVGLHEVALADMDCDGDLDLYLAAPGNTYYFENTGTPEEPHFGVPQSTVIFAVNGSFADIGGDGDLDYIAGSFVDIRYYENLSSPEVADFSYVQDDLTFSFTDNSSLLVGDIAEWLWDFGDGNTSDVQNPEHTFFENGAYDVCLSVWGDLDCYNTVCKTIYAPVFPWNAAPVADPFGLEDLPPFSIVRLRDFDDDGTTEAFAMTGENRYYKNNGDDAAPDFELVETNPFGIPPFMGGADPWIFDFVDIDGDCDPDIFFASRDDVNGNPLFYLENTGTPEAPWFGDSQTEINPFGFVQPVSDSIPGQNLGGFSWPTFVDIDADNDYDLFFNGRFLQSGSPVFDENFYFYRNDDPSVNGTSPQFTGPIKNPFNLTLPAVVPDAQLVSRFVDMDCDGDWDLFATHLGILIAYFENTGTPAAPHFSDAPVVWWANNPPPPPGFNAFVFGDWMDIGGDGDMDYIGPHGTPFTFFLENISDGTMACRGPIPEYEECIVATKDFHLDASLLLYPNPAYDLLAFDLQSKEPLGEVEIELFDLLGQKVKSLFRQSFGNFLQEKISLAGLSEGIYTLKISSEGKFIARKFVKMN